MKTNVPSLTTRYGFNMVEIMIVVAILGLLAAIAIPNFMKARETSQKNACIANLKQIDGAKNTWVVEKKGVIGATPTETDLYGPTAYIRDVPRCYAEGTYIIGPAGVKPACSIPGHTL